MPFEGGPVLEEVKQAIRIYKKMDPIQPLLLLMNLKGPIIDCADQLECFIGKARHLMHWVEEVRDFLNRCTFISYSYRDCIILKLCYTRL